MYPKTLMAATWDSDSLSLVLSRPCYLMTCIDDRLDLITNKVKVLNCRSRIPRHIRSVMILSLLRLAVMDGDAMMLQFKLSRGSQTPRYFAWTLTIQSQWILQYSVTRS
jgi:hypothetical protein